MQATTLSFDSVWNCWFDEMADIAVWFTLTETETEIYC